MPEMSDRADAHTFDVAHIADLIEAEASQTTKPGTIGAGDERAATGHRVADAVYTFDELTARNHADFVEHAYRAILRRAPSASERAALLAALLDGETKSYALGTLRYSDEGRRVGVEVQGLRRRYLVQALLHVPVVGPCVGWVLAVVRLPRSLRYFRALGERDAGESARLWQTLRSETERLADQVETLRTAATTLLELKDRIEALLPPPLAETLEIEGVPFAVPAAGRTCGLRSGAKVPLDDDERYAVFETAFYDSEIVATKQRVYLPLLDGIARDRPFLDLGCGRGEFLRILQTAGIPAVGVDRNRVAAQTLREAGFDIVEADIVAFLEREQRLFSGASLLQVVEHMSASAIERVLALLATRLVSGGLLIVETPNPLCPLALAQFHTDPTHVAPLPPERLRFSVEAAGFVRTRTLFQARAPRDVFAGPDPRGYYMDYAILAERP